MANLQLLGRGGGGACLGEAKSCLYKVWGDGGWGLLLYAQRAKAEWQGPRREVCLPALA